MVTAQSGTYSKSKVGRILSKLHHQGIQGSTHKLIEIFLTRRKQKVVVDGAESTASKVFPGVPQCPLFSPLR